MSKTLSLTSFEEAYVDQATELLTRSFAYDPSFAEIAQLSTDHGDFGALRELFRAQLISWGDQAHVDLAFLDDNLVGIATWSEPEALPDMEDIANHMIPIVGQDIWDRMLSGHKEELSYHPKFPHWYLYVIAVDPSAQGHGVGSALINKGLDRVGREAAYLEASTHRAARLYKRFDFALLGEIPTSDGTPGELAMWRSPAVPEEGPALVRPRTSSW